jgi:predicted nucleotide-binding protein
MSKAAIDSVLIDSRRRCALCFKAGDLQPKMGNVAHIVPNSDGGTDAFDNLVYLCAHHHALFDRIEKHDPLRQAVKDARDQLYQITNDSPGETSDRVLVVHGNRSNIAEEVNTYLHHLGLDAFDLSSNRTLGAPLFQRLQSISAFPYAIVLLSGDEWRTSDRVVFRRAPNPNVLFELGVLLSILGPQKVCTLCEPDVQLPSDLMGFSSLLMDPAGKWREVLHAELKASGLAMRTTGSPSRKGTTKPSEKSDHPVRR